MMLAKLKCALGTLAVVGLLAAAGGLLAGAFTPEPVAPLPEQAAQPPSAGRLVQQETDVARMAGTWLFDAASLNVSGRADSGLSRFWTSKLTVSGDSFSLVKFMDLSKDLKGKIVLNPAANPKTIDLKLDEFDLEAGGAPPGWGKLPACTLPGIYKLDGDRLTVCFPIALDVPRPTAFDGTGDKIAQVGLVRAGNGSTAFPDEVTVRVVGPGGQPAAGATVFGFMSLQENSPKKDAPKGAKPEWQYFESVKTGADGTAKMKYEKLRFHPLVVRDSENKGMAIVPISPVSLLKGEITIRLGPECRVTGAIACEELQHPGQSISWTNVYALQDGCRVASSSSFEGKFEFILPPGVYTLNAYGADLKGKYVAVTVPPDRSELTVEPIALASSKLTPLLGKPAPELAGVVGWKGKPAPLADLKGKYVLLEFWGYWCGPCVGSMPVLIELHEKFADKGLAVIGVHVDVDGEVDTADKLDVKIKSPKEKLWSGKDLPFPVALTSGTMAGEGGARTRGGAADQYGVLGYPTTILIDRDGKVVGHFPARDIKMATAEIEKLLAEKR